MPHSSLPSSDDITRVELPNGIVVLARPNFNSASTVFTGYFRAGSLYEPDEKLGLADFTAAALMRGTVRYNHLQMYNTLESVGASLGFYGNVHTSGFSGRALVEDLDMLLDITASALREPAFPEDEIEKLRAQLLTGLALRNENTEAMAGLLFDQIAYPNHPYSRPAEGHAETIQAITRADIADFHRDHYGPQGMVITIVGGLDPAAAVEKVSRALGDWANPRQPDLAALPDLAPLRKTVTRRVTIPGKSQADLIMGVAGPPRNTPGFLALSLGNHVLGQFGMYGRIGERVREKAGLAYHAYSTLTGSVGPGPWSVSAGAAPENIEQALNLITDELRQFVENGVTEDELADSKANYIGRLPLSLESNVGVAASLISLERHSLGLNYYRAYPDRISVITTQDVLAAIRRHLDPERLAIAIAGS